MEVNLVCLGKSSEDAVNDPQLILLDGEKVPYISSWLDDLPNIQPHRLAQNKRLAFNGDFLHGTGFVIGTKEAEQLLRENPRNSKCLFPYLGGRDVNSDIRQGSERYTICFHDYSLEEASQYPVLLDILKKRVKPQRDKVKRRSHRLNWWLYGDYRRGLRVASANLEKLLVRSMVSEYHMLAFVPNDQILSIALVVFAYDDYFHFALLQSWLHEVWLRRQASSLRTDIRYTPTDCFQTFPFPQSPSAAQEQLAAEQGQRYYEHRQQYMLASELGLTKTYNLFHDPTCTDPEIQEIRRLHAEMDHSILTCYGWEDINLEHGFYPNDRKKIRYMPSPKAQREILTRLIAFNQEIAEQEAAQGLTTESDESEKEDVDTDDT